MQPILQDLKNVGGTEHWRIHKQFFSSKNWVIHRHEWCIGNHGLPMTGFGEFIRKSRSAYEEIQTSKASSLKGCIIRDIFRKASDFCQNITSYFWGRKQDTGFCWWAEFFVNIFMPICIYVSLYHFTYDSSLLLFLAPAPDEMAFTYRCSSVRILLAWASIPIGVCPKTYWRFHRNANTFCPWHQ